MDRKGTRTDTDRQDSTAIPPTTRPHDSHLAERLSGRIGCLTGGDNSTPKGSPSFALSSGTPPASPPAQPLPITPFCRLSAADRSRDQC
ncbi:hypothetical protein ACOMHN_025458 [Nucella lapillus]